MRIAARSVSSDDPRRPLAAEGNTPLTPVSPLTKRGHTLSDPRLRISLTPGGDGVADKLAGRRWDFCFMHPNNEDRVVFVNGRRMPEKRNGGTPRSVIAAERQQGRLVFTDGSWIDFRTGAADGVPSSDYLVTTSDTVHPR